MTRVVHFNTVKDYWNVRAGGWDVPGLEYIGRENPTYHLPQSPWANPIKLHSDSVTVRAQLLDQYHTWLTTTDEGKKLLPHLPKLRGKTLVCWCAPKACHGDVLLELLGEKVRPDQPVQASLDGVQAKRPALLLWDNGGATFKSGMDKRGQLYRTSEPIQHSLGVPGKVYLTHDEWYRDWIKMTLRVTGCAPLSGMKDCEYARFRYETRLEGLEGLDDERSEMETEILHELMAELEGSTDVE